jgi:hypothetical protein
MTAVTIDIVIAAIVNGVAIHIHIQTVRRSITVHIRVFLVCDAVAINVRVDDVRETIIVCIERQTAQVTGIDSHSQQGRDQAVLSGSHIGPRSGDHFIQGHARPGRLQHLFEALSRDPGNNGCRSQGLYPFRPRQQVVLGELAVRRERARGKFKAGLTVKPGGRF